MIKNKKMLLSYILRQVKWDTAFVGLFCSAIYLLDNFVVKMTQTIQITAFLCFAISLVRAFKLNQSYKRGRKVAGTIGSNIEKLLSRPLEIPTNQNQMNLIPHIRSESY